MVHTTKTTIILPCPLYASLCLSPSLYGSYVYAFLGTSGQLTIGPVVLVGMYVWEEYL